MRLFNARLAGLHAENAVLHLFDCFTTFSFCHNGINIILKINKCQTQIIEVIISSSIDFCVLFPLTIEIGECNRKDRSKKREN
jgi:hypothetical protein